MVRWWHINPEPGCMFSELVHGWRAWLREPDRCPSCVSQLLVARSAQTGVTTGHTTLSTQRVLTHTDETRRRYGYTIIFERVGVRPAGRGQRAGPRGRRSLLGLDLVDAGDQCAGADVDPVANAGEAHVLAGHVCELGLVLERRHLATSAAEVRRQDAGAGAGCCGCLASTLPASRAGRSPLLGGVPNPLISLTISL